MNMANNPRYVKQKRQIVDHFVRKSRCGMMMSGRICVAEGDGLTDEPKNLRLANQGERSAG
jgi:hypothetical protein